MRRPFCLVFAIFLYFAYATERVRKSPADVGAGFGLGGGGGFGFGSNGGGGGLGGGLGGGFQGLDVIREEAHKLFNKVKDGINHRTRRSSAIFGDEVGGSLARGNAGLENSGAGGSVGFEGSRESSLGGQARAKAFVSSSATVKSQEII